MGSRQQKIYFDTFIGCLGPKGLVDMFSGLGVVLGGLWMRRVCLREVSDCIWVGFKLGLWAGSLFLLRLSSGLQALGLNT